MDELIARALDTAQAQGAQYADVRLVRQERQLVLVRSGTVEEVSLGEDAGFGVRALVDGAWGFASSYRTDPAEADAVAGEACASPAPAPASTSGRCSWGSRCAAGDLPHARGGRPLRRAPGREDRPPAARGRGDAPGARRSRPPPPS